MGWERRPSGRFYYSARKINGRVVKTYVGRGVVGEIAAGLEAEARQKRAEQSAALRAEQDRLAIPQQAMQELDRACSRMIAATLIAAGFHQVDYKWRRRHVGKSRLSNHG